MNALTKGICELPIESNENKGKRLKIILQVFCPCHVCNGRVLYLTRTYIKEVTYLAVFFMRCLVAPMSWSSTPLRTFSGVL